MGGFLFGKCSDCCGDEADCDCGDCNLNCCLTIQGRNTCEGGTVLISPDPIVENWGLAETETFFQATWQYLSYDRDAIVEVVFSCNAGTLALDVTVSEFIPSVQAGGSLTSYRRWANAVAILNEDCCPVGVDLGALTDSAGSDPTFVLGLGWVCT